MPMAFPVRLGRALSAVARSMPSLQIRCVPAWADHLTVERLQVGDLDAIVVVGPVTADVLCTEDLGWLPRAAILAPDHPLVGRGAIDLTDLLDLPTFRRPDGVLPQWRSFWLLEEERGGTPTFSRTQCVSELDAMVAIASGEVAGIAPWGWGSGMGLRSMSVAGLTDCPVQLVTRAGDQGPAGLALRRELFRLTGPAPGLMALSPGQRRVATLVAAGMSNAEIAGQLTLSVRTVESHVSAAIRRMDVDSRTQLVAAVATSQS